MSLEKIIRPAQSPDIPTAKASVVRRSAVQPSPITIEIGIGGSIKQLSGSFQASYTLYAVKKPQEKRGRNT